MICSRCFRRNEQSLCGYEVAMRIWTQQQQLCVRFGWFFGIILTGIVNTMLRTYMRALIKLNILFSHFCCNTDIFQDNWPQCFCKKLYCFVARKIRLKQIILKQWEDKDNQRKLIIKKIKLQIGQPLQLQRNLNHLGRVQQKWMDLSMTGWGQREAEIHLKKMIWNCF